MVPVLSFSIAVNLPKFFEAYVETEKHEILPNGYELWADNTVRVNGTILENFTEEDLEYEYRYRIEVTDLRKNPYYTIYYTNWTRFFIMGIIPTVLLIYFNYKVIFWLRISSSSIDSLITRYLKISQKSLILQHCEFSRQKSFRPFLGR